MLADPNNLPLYQLSPTSINDADRDKIMQDIIQKRRNMRSSGKLYKSQISSSLKVTRPKTSEHPSRAISPANGGMIIKQADKHSIVEKQSNRHTQMSGTLQPWVATSSESMPAFKSSQDCLNIQQFDDKCTVQPCDHNTATTVTPTTSGR